MTGRIVTVRHGRPDLSRDVVIDARAYGDWWAAYDRAGLRPEERPPPSLVDRARGATHILSSPLPRARDTARRLADAAALGSAGEAIPSDPLFVEAELPPPPTPFVRLRPGQWGVVSRVFWIAGYAPGTVEGHAAAWRRVGRAAERLIGLAEAGDVVLCAHGYFNWMLDRRLRALGWRRVAAEGGNGYWSWRRYAPASEVDAEPSDPHDTTGPSR